MKYLVHIHAVDRMKARMLICSFQELFTAEHNWKDLPWITSFDGFVASAGSLLYSFEGQAMVGYLNTGTRSQLNVSRYIHPLVGSATRK